MTGAKLGLLALIFSLLVPVVVTAYSGITTISYSALYLLLLLWVAAEFFRSLLARRAGKACFVESQFRQILSRMEFVVLAASKKGVFLG